MIFEFLHVAVEERRGHDVFGRVVEERRAGIILYGPLRPRRLEHLVGRAPEQDASHRLVMAPMASPISGRKP